MLHEINAAGYHTGYSLPEASVCPAGFARGELPTLQAGEHARWDGAQFAVTTQAPPDAPAPTVQVLALSLALNTTKQMMGQPITITATFDLPISENFAVPIVNEAGQTVRVKLAQVRDGSASLSVSFDKSGYYRITEAALNSRLPKSLRIALAEPLEIVIYE